MTPTSSTVHWRKKKRKTDSSTAIPEILQFQIVSEQMEGHKNDQRDGTPLLWWQAQGVGASKKRRLQGDLIAAFQYLKGPTRKLESDFWQGHLVIGQGVTASGWKRVGLDYILGRNSLLRGWWDTGTGCPEKLWLPHHRGQVFKARLDAALSNLI